MDSDKTVTFEKFGVTYQEKTAQAILVDLLFAEQMHDVLDPKFFELQYLQTLSEKFFDYKKQFKMYPSVDLMKILISQDDRVKPLVRDQINRFLDKIIENPLNGDAAYIQSSSLDFCRKQVLKEAVVKVIEKLEDSDYDSMQGVIRDALAKGVSHDMGHDYLENFATRRVSSNRQPISTGWKVLDRCLNGGWERKTLTTFIAPTGAGKSMFLVNCGAAGIEQGLNVLYVTCEMADFKIGIRFDSYFSGVEINSVAEKQEEVESSVRSKATGRLFIKEFPTKTATVQTIRNYIQRLITTKGFTPDMVIIDYADLLRGSRGYGDKRFELEGVYEELRAIAQEFNIVMITADQTNRSGLDMEIVTIGQIGESYAKATVCDLIMTISRKPEDKQFNTGRLFVAKSRLGQDGIVYPFTLNTATVKVGILEAGDDAIALYMQNNSNLRERAGDAAKRLMGSSNSGTSSASR